MELHQKEKIVFTLEKEPEPNLLEFAIQQSPFIAILFFFVPKKNNKLIISSNSTKLFLRNKLHKEIYYNAIDELTFDPVRPKFENGKSEKLILEKLMLTYEESQGIKKALQSL